MSRGKKNKVNVAALQYQSLGSQLRSLTSVVLGICVKYEHTELGYKLGAARGVLNLISGLGTHRLGQSWGF